MYSRLTTNFQSSSCLCLPKCWDYKDRSPLSGFISCSCQCLDVEPIYWGYHWVFPPTPLAQAVWSSQPFSCVSLLSIGTTDTSPCLPPFTLYSVQSLEVS